MENENLPISVTNVRFGRFCRLASCRNEHGRQTYSEGGAMLDACVPPISGPVGKARVLLFQTVS